MAAGDKRFFCCVPPRTGCLFWGCLEITLSLISLIVILTGNWKGISGSDSYIERVILEIRSLIFSSLLLHGIVRKKPHFIFAYLVETAIALAFISAVVMVAGIAILIVHPHASKGFLIIICVLIGFSLMSYILEMVNAARLDIMKENNDRIRNQNLINMDSPTAPQHV